jgi:hypothetical protein
MKTGKRFRVHKHKCLLKSDPDFIALLTTADLWVTPQFTDSLKPYSRQKSPDLMSGLCLKLETYFNGLMGSSLRP